MFQRNQYQRYLILLIFFISGITLIYAVDLNASSHYKNNLTKNKVNEIPTYSQYPPSIQRIKDKNTLVVALIKDDQIPFFFWDKDGNKLNGLDIDIARKIAKILKVSIVFNREAKNFNELSKIILSRKADIIISKYSHTVNRSAQLYFTEPYLRLRHSLLFNRKRLAHNMKEYNNRYSNKLLGHKGNIKLKDYLNNYDGTIGVLRNSSFERYSTEAFPNAKIIKYSSWFDLVKATLDGKVSALYRDDFEVKKVVRFYSGALIKLKSVVLDYKIDNIAMAVHPKDHHLLHFINFLLKDKNFYYKSNQVLKMYKYELASYIKMLNEFNK